MLKRALRCMIILRMFIIHAHFILLTKGKVKTHSTFWCTKGKVKNS